MRKMKRFGTILGILLTVTILISGSAVAWVYAYWIDEDNTTDIDYIDDLDGNHASLGEHNPPAPPVLGWVLLDLGSGNEMPNSQDFTVFADSIGNETYDVSVGETPNPAATEYVGTGYDTQRLTFQTPSTGDDAWRYILIEGKTGGLSLDPAYGPDIDAVGWDK